MLVKAKSFIQNKSSLVRQYEGLSVPYLYSFHDERSITRTFIDQYLNICISTNNSFNRDKLLYLENQSQGCVRLTFKSYNHPHFLDNFLKQLSDLRLLLLRDERLFHDYIEELSGSAKKNSRNPTLIRPYDLHVELEILELLKNQFKESMDSFKTSTEKNRALLNEVTDVFQRKVILMRMQLKLVIFSIYSKPIV